MFEILEINLDGFTDKKGITYIGAAKRQENGKYVCLANVGGALCRVEVSITPVEVSTDLREEDLHECQDCSTKPGSPMLCARCLRAREAAGNRWKGPRRQEG